MVVELKVCGFEIKGLTKLIATTGIALSIFSLLMIVYIPFSLVLLAGYILLLIGFLKKRTSYLLSGQIAFSTSITINFVLVIASLILVFKLDDDFEIGRYDYNVEPVIEISKHDLRIIVFSGVIIVFLLTAFTIFSIIVTQKLRNLLIFEYLDANLPPEEPRPRLNLNFGNIYSSDPNPDDLRLNYYSNPNQMSPVEYINLNQR